MNNATTSALRKYFLPGSTLLFLLLIALTTFYMRSLGQRNDALIEAVLRHDFNRVNSLLHQGVDPNLQISFDAQDRPHAWAPMESWGLGKPLGPPIRNTPLILASGNGDDPMVRLLLANGAHINAEAHFSHQTALLAAIAGKHQTTVELLLQSHANPMILDYDGYDAIAWAVQHGDPEILKTVLKYCREVPLTKRYNGMTAMDWAKKARNKAVIKVLEDYVLQNGHSGSG